MFTRAAVDRVGGACLRRAACSLRLVRGQLARGLARRRASCLAAALRDRSGAAAIEFALVAPLFLLLLVGILEISIMFFTSSVIEGATKEAARQIRTGQIQGSGNPLTTFRNELCGALYNIIDCNEVLFHVQTFSSFQTVSMPLELDEDGEIVNTTFVPGGSGAVTVVRAMYRWEFMTPFIAEVIPAGFGGHLIVSTVAFQNEPYSVN
jgi:Flp pilus assembly protein TadG